MIVDLELMLLLIYLYLDRAEKNVFWHQNQQCTMKSFGKTGQQLSASLPYPDPSPYPNSDVGNIGNTKEFVSFLEFEEAVIQIKST